MKSFNLWMFFVEGGWGMWSTLLFGGVALGGAVWFAIRPDLRRLAFTASMWLTLLTATFHAMLTNVAAVFSFLGESEQIADNQVTRVLLVGLKESTRPGALGGLFLTLVPICLAIGALRAQKLLKAQD
jgi:hypothetical protein